MGRLAADDGIGAVIASPHQSGAYEHITPAMIRHRVIQLRDMFARHHIELDIVPGAEVHATDDLAARVARGDILTLADRRRHVLIQIPHEATCRQSPPLPQLVESFGPYNMQLILARPERHRGILRQWDLVETLVDDGCLMQVTAGALTGAFGVEIRAFAEWLVQERLVHLVGSDGHGAGARRPLLSRAYHRVCHLTDRTYADEIFRRNPHRILCGELIPVVARRTHRYRFANWFRWRRAG